MGTAAGWADCSEVSEGRAAQLCPAPPSSGHLAWLPTSPPQPTPRLTSGTRKRSGRWPWAQCPARGPSARGPALPGFTCPGPPSQGPEGRTLTQALYSLPIPALCHCPRLLGIHRGQCGPETPPCARWTPEGARGHDSRCWARRCWRPLARGHLAVGMATSRGPASLGGRATAEMGGTHLGLSPGDLGALLVALGSAKAEHSKEQILQELRLWAPGPPSPLGPLFVSCG